MNKFDISVLCVCSLLGCLAACSSEPEERKPVPEQARPVFHGVKQYANSPEIRKICDEGRAVYWFDGGYNGGLVVVENAKECAQ